jgi:hypothetical protein
MQTAWEAQRQAQLQSLLDMRALSLALAGEAQRQAAAVSSHAAQAARDHARAWEALAGATSTSHRCS